MARIQTLDLTELYAKVAETGRALPSVASAIRAKEDFSLVSFRYCDLVCRAHDNKSPLSVSLDSSEVDVVILVGEKSKDERFKSGSQLDSVYETMLDHMMSHYCYGMTYKIVYGLKCRPPASATKPLTVTASKPCFSYALHEITSANPKVIIATSTSCLKGLDMKLSVKNNISEIRYWNDIPVVITLHPKVTTMIRQSASGAFWGDDFYALIRKDFEKAREVALGHIVQKDPRATIKHLVDTEQIKVLRSLEEVRELCSLLSSMPESKVISWDTETTGLDPWALDAKFLCMQFGYRHEDGLCRAYVIPLWHRDNCWVDPDKAWPLVEHVLKSDVSKVGHHGKFDLKYTRVVQGTHVKNYRFDTLYAIHSLCSGLQGTYGLKKAVWDWIPESGLGGYEDLLFENIALEEEVTCDE